MQLLEVLGFEINKTKKVEDQKNLTQSLEEPNNDGSVIVGDGFNIDYTNHSFNPNYKDHRDLIKQYRKMANCADVASAIDEIVNEAIAFDADVNPVEIILDKSELSASIKNKVKEEFDEILKLLKFNEMGDDIFKRWYVDGRLYNQIIVDKEKPQEGIQKIVELDPINIKKIKKIKKEKDENNSDVIVSVKVIYQYDNKETNNRAIIADDAISYIHSGILENKTIISYLHQAIKPHNHLEMVEDSTVIYTMARAPQRRVFYVDIGQLPRTKGDQYLKEYQLKFKNKMVYDASTGTIKDTRHQMSMLEDIWLPRREGSKGTEVDTLDGGGELIENDKIMYFLRKLYKALRVPLSRLETENNFGVGRTSEITRDEIKFSRFAEKLRKKFSNLFFDLLRLQLVMKNIINEEEWDKIKEKITFDFNKDSHFAELKEAEIFKERIDQLSEMDEMVGKYYSIAWVRKNILKQSEDDIKKIDKEIADEKDAGEIDVEEGDEENNFNKSSKKDDETGAVDTNAADDSDENKQNQE
jgi:hypothetical protein